MTVMSLACFRRGLNVRSFVVNWLSLRCNMKSVLDSNLISTCQVSNKVGVKRHSP